MCVEFVVCGLLVSSSLLMLEGDCRPGSKNCRSAPAVSYSQLFTYGSPVNYDHAYFIQRTLTYITFVAAVVPKVACHKRMFGSDVKLSRNVHWTGAQCEIELNNSDDYVILGLHAGRSTCSSLPTTPGTTTVSSDPENKYTRPVLTLLKGSMVCVSSVLRVI